MSIQNIVEEIDLRFTSANGVPVERATIPAAEWEALKAAIAAKPVAQLHIDKDEFDAFVKEYDTAPCAGGMFHFSDEFVRRFNPPEMVDAMLSLKGRYTAEHLIRFLYGLE